MISLPQSAIEIIETMKKSGHFCFAVGGSVRDSLIGRATKDWDFTTNATPEEILSLFPDSFYDNQFGTVGVKIKKDEKLEDIYEITTFRSEEGYTDHRHPDKITWGKTLEEDLSRRDFTMNAIAYDGKIFTDPYEGKKDIQNKLIRTVGDPYKRFAEDALRMIRAVRFAAQLGFIIDEKTTAAILANAKLLTQIANERIRDEFLKILGSDHAADAMIVLKNVGLLTYILPELEVAFATPQKSPKRHHLYDVGTHSVMALKFCPSKDPIVRLATLLHDLGKPATFKKTDDGVLTFYNHEVAGVKISREVVKRLRLSRVQAEKVNTLVRWHQFTVDERQTDSALRRFIRHVGKENIDDMLALRIGDRLGGGARETSWRLELYKKRLEEVQKQPFDVSDLLADGHDVMKIFAIGPGRIIGQTLDILFKEVEAGTLPNEREALLKRLYELSLSPIYAKEKV
ncbi:MAG: HD domain-containing protein [Patescibacteria group bacterium]